jgi:hypothetical protein
MKIYFIVKNCILLPLHFLGLVIWYICIEIIWCSFEIFCVIQRTYSVTWSIQYTYQHHASHIFAFYIWSVKVRCTWTIVEHSIQYGSFYKQFQNFYTWKQEFRNLLLRLTYCLYKYFNIIISVRYSDICTVLS